MKTPQPSILFLAVVLLALTQVLHAQTATSVTVHTGNFSGLKQQLAPGRYNHVYLAQSGITMVGSITVPAGFKVTLYPQDEFNGQPLELREDATTRYLKANGFADIGLQVSLIVETLPKGEPPVKPPFITLYEHNFSGATKNLAEGRYQFYEFGRIDNDQVSAVKVPKNMKVTLYENEGYSGRSLTLTQDATADFLIKNKFNDATSSVWVEAIPVEDKPVITKPGKEPITKDSVKAAPATESIDKIVTIFQGDFSGVSKALVPGKYALATLGIGNDELSSISIKKGYRVKLFADDNFKGKSITLNEGANTARLTQLEFNNVTSSLIVEAIPTVKVFEGAAGSRGAVLLPGNYDLDVLIDYNILDNEISTVEVPAGYRVILYDLEKFKGRSLILTESASADFLASKNFNNVTSSLTVEEFVPTAAEPEPKLMATLYEQDFNGRSQTLAAGKYEHTDLIMGNNAVSSVSVPYGLRVMLYEYGAQEGRVMTLTRNATTAFFQQNQFDNLTSSVVVEERPAGELYVTIYADTYSGPSQQLKPGKYTADDILIGSKQLTSLRVPKGLMVMLYESRNFTGSSVTIERDKDFSDSKIFNDHFSSIIVEDISQPEVSPVPTTVVVKEKPAPVVADTVVQTVVEVVSAPDCSLTEKEYYIALKAIEAKAFSGEKMQTAKLAIDGKCLTNEQIRGLAKSFSFEDQTLEFVLSTYPLAKEKSTFYSLEDIFSYMSSKEKFNSFLKENR